MSETMHALVRTALAPVRAEPNVRAEQVSQEPMGAVLEILERSDTWVRVKGEDGHEGWMNEGGLRFCSAEEGQAWWDDAGGRPTVVLDATLVDDSGRALVRLPWGARVAVDDQHAHLPDGRSGRLSDGRWVGWAELGDHFPQTGDAVVATALEWMGVPYLWGGRTRWGTDCSGFVQAIYRLHGFHLPRDSYEQAEVGEAVTAGSDFVELRPGDLLFFRAVDSPRVVHVALSLGGPAVLHAAEANGYVMEDDLTADSQLGRSLAKRVAELRRLFG
jgi:hypothetical protein